MGDFPLPGFNTTWYMVFVKNWGVFSKFPHRYSYKYPTTKILASHVKNYRRASSILAYRMGIF